MTSAELGKCLGYLKAFYSNWNLDVTNEFVLEVWYEALKMIDYQMFRKMLQQYCKDNKYAPSSPNDFLSMIPKTYSVDDAWEIVLDVINRASEKQIILNMLSKYQVIYKIVIPLLDLAVEEDSFKNKCYGYSIGRYFKRDYRRYLDTLTIRYEGNLLISNSKQLLTNKDTKYIE